ncbi:hypothetical protein [Streptosporangium sp. NBC_01756]|uniref:hypothetical protein n=1 Tax=Streptosporangium sp. NBC_01756 TaxID=2975950 RepID=UPI002DD8B8CE|nr:hypothetical protein [Streptosporangium sp. NBC_01756]WSC88921.1 hypothetical protein OIE48_12260 [Streptosporangium sp. NBC_01756]
MKKTIFTLMASAAVTAAVVLAPGVAQAEPLPSGCKSGINGATPPEAYAYCTGGGGYVRVYVTCAKGSAKKRVAGPWKVNAGEDRISFAHCPSSYPKPVAHSYDIKR